MNLNEQLGWLRETIRNDDHEESIAEWLNDHLAALRENRIGFMGDAEFYARAVRNLRQGRFFSSLDLLAEAAFKRGVWNDRLVIDWSQALIHLGRFTRAIELLVPICDKLRGVSPTPKELPEVLGHLGRAYKDLAIWAKPNATEPRFVDLQRSLDYYREGYELDKSQHYWHGVNLVAVSAFRSRILDPTSSLSEADKELAQTLFHVVDNLIANQRDEAKEIDPWALATRGELHVALGNTEEAAKDYADFARICLDRFSPGSSARQLRELWGLREDTAPGYRILPILHNRSLELFGPMNIQLQTNVLQARFGDMGYVDLTWWKLFLELAKGVVRIRDKRRGNWVGTGFLVAGETLLAEWTHKTVLLTCNHVVSGNKGLGADHLSDSLSLDEADFMLLVAGEAAGSGPIQLQVGTILKSYDVKDLDVTIVEVTELPESAKPLAASSVTPKVGPKERVYVMGYVGDPELKVSFDDNLLLDVRQDGWLCYRTPTTHGFSGGPVFDRSLKVVGVHSRANHIGTYNQGMSIDTLKKRLGEDSQSSA